MSISLISILFLLVLVPVILSMLAWTTWTVYKICQPEANELDEWELLHLNTAEEPELETTGVGVQHIQRRRRDRKSSFGEDYSYNLGQNMGYGIPVSWIQNLGERRN